MEMVAAGLAAPRDVCIRLHVFHLEGLARIAPRAALFRTKPTKVEGDLACHRRTSVEQPVQDVPVVGDRQILQVEARFGVFDICFNRVVWYGDRPKEAAASDSRVVVVDLSGECRVNLTLVNVQSNESEGATVALAVGADVDTFHEPVVRSKLRVRRESFAVVRTGSGPTDFRHSNCPLEVEDRRLICICLGGQKVKECSVRGWDSRAIWNRGWRC
jgi:hypothetical protein